MITAFSQLFIRDIEKLNTEISSFKDEQNLWKISGGVKNCAGSLCLHLCGNLQHFIGAVLGNSGYIRNRDEEFTKKNISINLLLAGIDKTKTIVESTFKKMDDSILPKIYPVNKYGEEMTTGYFLLHLYGHLGYHLGQVNYLRRIIDNQFRYKESQ